MIDNKENISNDKKNFFADEKNTDDEAVDGILNRLKYRKIISGVDENTTDNNVKGEYYKEMLFSIIENIKNPKTILYIVGVIALIVGVFIYSGKQNVATVSNTTPLITASDNIESVNGTIVVEVSGQVKQPTVLSVKQGTRIFQAIELAGGLTKKADTKGLNLAAVIQDAEKIYVPKIGEKPAQETPSTSGSSDSASSSGSNTSNKINLNSATTQELQNIPGVGPATAQKILDYKQSSGSFKSVDDLLNVAGIGEKTLEKIKPYVCV
jgi:competence protein ComEA